MNYFLDTEFLEGPQKKRIFGIPYGETPNTIDLISIGIVSEDGREYYAISKDFNLKEAWNRYQLKDLRGLNFSYDIFGVPNGVYKYKKEYWIRENVLRPIFDELLKRFDAESSKSLRMGIYIGTIVEKGFSYKVMKYLINRYGKTNKEISNEVVKFTYDDVPVQTIGTTTIRMSEESQLDLRRGYPTPVFYAYYADYDWVVFCWLFGKMIDLPKGFPMYCNDLKQCLDEYCDSVNVVAKTIPGCPLVTAKSVKENNPKFPKQDKSKQHNAIEDARWNKELFNFLNKI
ncbi:Rnase H [Cellulophaga phage phi46:3]|uniref:Uncharacterized protein n=2 Tax=Pachyviridae TaxID=2946166 RepID=R9ZZS0_9CAUD|nr:Rnase H [Cellulophaga phage phi46:3]YP_008241272.1 Rnase H [Cellulophaga phage phi18:3]AGO48591.1 hypothetical protein Phi18:3_gp079 [Cellulophaga phage phi18:3]AGO48817.1 hypothetical protein Phi46:3_gp073 [Cellulophaga phage phi46:3]